jgi:diketogulonate reductase-like aldo/keto reductase
VEAILLNRREFNQRCAAFSLSLPALGTTTEARASNSPRTVKFLDGIVVPALGQGSWHLGEGRHPDAVEEEALRTGLSLGMTLIDTSEGYSNGRSEELIGRVIAGQRDRVFLVSKVDRATDIAGACEASLARLGTNYLDLYLLHWPMPGADLSAVVAAFESLRMSGKIRAWGVSNFKVSDMEDLFRVPDGHRCATNQVLYNLNSAALSAICFHGASSAVYQ